MRRGQLLNNYSRGKPGHASFAADGSSNRHNWNGNISPPLKKFFNDISFRQYPILTHIIRNSVFVVLIFAIFVVLIFTLFVVLIFTLFVVLIFAIFVVLIFTIL